MEPISTVAELYQYILKTQDSPTALNWRDEKGAWQAVSTQEYLTQVRRLALGLVAHGVQPGDKIGIMARPCPGWTVADLAIILIGAVTVPLYASLSSKSYLYEIEQTSLKTLFISGENEWQKCKQHRNHVETVIALDEESQDPTALALTDLMAAGDVLEKENPGLWDRLLLMAKGDDVASIVYTSGSTGTPKGVEVTQRNLVGLLHLDPLHWDQAKDRYLSFLPMAHIFARVLNYIMIQAGVSIYYLDDVHAAAPVSQELKPTILVLVPRLLEKVYGKIQAKVRAATGLKGKLGRWACALAEEEQRGGVLWRLQAWLADKLVYGKLRGIFGGQMRVIVSGGAKLNPHLGHFFTQLGYPIYEGWGMTEACPITVNQLGSSQIGSVGQPLEGMEIRIGKDNEFQVRGPVVMKGYYRNPDATAEILDADGWLATGDQGSIDAEGYVTIIGRTKELYKTSTGEYIAPIPIEQKLAKAPLVDHALVIAEARSYCSCLLFPDPEALEALKATYAMSDLSDEQFLATPQISEEMERHFEEVNRGLNSWEEVHAYRWICQPISVESGELTPTMKIRRGVIIERYQDLVEEMYTKEEAA